MGYGLSRFLSVIQFQDRSDPGRRGPCSHARTRSPQGLQLLRDAVRPLSMFHASGRFLAVWFRLAPARTYTPTRVHMRAYVHTRLRTHTCAYAYMRPCVMRTRARLQYTARDAATRRDPGTVFSSVNKFFKTIFHWNFNVSNGSWKNLKKKLLTRYRVGCIVELSPGGSGQGLKATSELPTETNKIDTRYRV